ncbi:hypothetical protein L1987_14225 [Smallanthus sonchifolius]|uniref:Uncharacterized protein n=1 Tax=Smallanthus sonchifolius TaxID=185202 RepID=A0ACB9J488_9ASTR|nr:hypothetical protein L1987_14225 [Smallanthus sonchifolius]
MSPFAILLFSLFILHHRVTSELVEEEKEALLSFIAKVPHDESYNWKESEPACSSWKGVECDPTNTHVFYLRLPAASLIGEIPPNTIGKLSSLRILSLHGNHLNGTIPSEFNSLASLTHLFLHNNKFSGQLRNINAKEFRKLDVSNNVLTGPIPNSLSKFPKSKFSGNRLCNAPLAPCNRNIYPSPAPSPEPYEQMASDKKSKKKNIIIGVSVGSGLLLLILLCCLRKRVYQQSKRPPKPSLEAPAVASVEGMSTEGERNKLVMFDDRISSFDYEDLLQSSADVLGKGSVGTSYKHVLKAKKMTVVVKRLKDGEATKMEFESCMEVLGKLKNEYVVPLRGYCYLEDEKWLVYDYMHAGSLFAHLHGSLSLSGTRLDWNNRMSIALSAAKGVAYLHMCSVVHGNIKSSNILLRQETNKDATVSDYDLNTLFSRWSSSNHRATGYWSPEVVTTQKFSFKSDVYSFGVFLLEILTGKDPNPPSSGEVQNDFPLWVQLVIRKEPKAEIFDVELRRDENIKEMSQMFRIAKDCVSIVVDQRPTMQEVVSMMKEMPQVEPGDWLRQSSDDSSKGYDDILLSDTRDKPSTITP